MAKTITVTFDKGEATVETKGFTGGDCLKATLELEDALGGKTADRKTAEFHVSPLTQKQTVTR